MSYAVLAFFFFFFFFFSSRRRHTRYWRDWSSDVCSSDLGQLPARRSQKSALDVSLRHRRLLRGGARGQQSGACPNREEPCYAVDRSRLVDECVTHAVLPSDSVLPER